ncbi:pEP153R [African swine fever virus]|uniref:Lectin-like protein EP153R n=1 Tax=African swine fever virus TaxID=10497 RepID=O89329_ASF|nr:lectin homolog [African swine fever virus]QST86977.1 pEP153R [African swine fever virus]
MFSNKKYTGLIDKNYVKKILDDSSTIKICYILIGILIGTNMITLIYNFIFWENYIKCIQNDDKMFYCPKDWVGYNNVCYYFSNNIDEKNYTAASNSCKQLNSTLANNDTNLLNLTKKYNYESGYWVNYSLANNQSVILRNSSYTKKVNYTGLLFICSK